MSKIIIKELTDDIQKNWDEIVDSSPNSTLFHRYKWLKLAEKHSKTKLQLILGLKGHEIIAAIPFFYYEKYHMKRLISPSDNLLIQHLGPIFPDYDQLKSYKKESYFKDFQKKLDIFISKNFKPDLIKITSSPRLIDIRPYLWGNYTVIPQFNYFKKLKDIDLIWDDFKKELRKNIKKAEKKDVEIKISGKEGYKYVLKSLIERMGEQGIESVAKKNYQYFIDLYQKFYPDNIKVFNSYYNNEIVGGIIALLHKKTVSIWVGATRSDLKGIYPVDLLQWNIIKWAFENSYKNCEIYGANIPSISYFKSRYNFDLQLYYKIKKYSKKFSMINFIRKDIQKFLK